MNKKLNKATNIYELNSYLFEYSPQSLSEYNRIEDAYLKVLKSYCKHWLKLQFKSTIRFLFGLTDQNWDRLHESDEEEEESVEDLFKSFRYEFVYVYDRFSYSRMLRLHYNWIIFSKKFFRQRMIDQKIDPLNKSYYDYYDYLEEYQQKFLK